MAASKLAVQYQTEWWDELRTRKITPNGANPEAQRALAEARGHVYKPPTPAQALAKSAKALAKAAKQQGHGRIYVEPNPWAHA